MDVKKAISSNIRHVIAEDIPRSLIPGYQPKSAGGLKIVFLSRICEHKNLAFAIDAVMAMNCRDIAFTICGPIQEQNYWEKCLEKLKESDNDWTYKGDIPSEQVQSVLTQQDVLLLPTKSENYGHVIFEALSVGCIPVISDRTPWSAVSSSGAGYVLPLDGPQFTKALDALAEMSLEDRYKMAQASVALAKGKLEEIEKTTGYRIIFG